VDGSGFAAPPKRQDVFLAVVTMEVYRTLGEGTGQSISGQDLSPRYSE
jgi:hypothetical protein